MVFGTIFGKRPGASDAGAAAFLAAAPVGFYALDRAGRIGHLIVATEDQPPSDDQHDQDGEADPDPAEQLRARMGRLDTQERVEILLGRLLLRLLGLFAIGHPGFFSVGV